MTTRSNTEKLWTSPVFISAPQCIMKLSKRWNSCSTLCTTLTCARDKSKRQIESHIFFDGAIKGDVLNNYVLQLISLIPKALKVKIETCMKLKTPYGMQMRWRLPGGMLFHIHLKDNLRVSFQPHLMGSVWKRVQVMVNLTYTLCSRLTGYRIRNVPVAPHLQYFVTWSPDFTKLAYDFVKQ